METDRAAGNDGSMARTAATGMTMQSGLECIVRVWGGDSPDHLEFLGTGMLVEPGRVLTCKHVVGARDPYKQLVQPFILASHLLVESAAGRRVGASVEAVAPDCDLALLQLDAPLAGEVPPFLWHLTEALEPQLRTAPLQVVGYTANDRSAPRQYSITKLLILPTYREGTLLDFQFHGGLVEGMSGSPVLVAFGDQWAYVGTAFRGGEGAASSRMIMADPVGQFLIQEAGLGQLNRVDATRALGLAPGAPVGAESRSAQPASAHDLPLPYRHLDFFREIDAPYFHGREAETEIVLEMVQQFPRQPFVALIGPSGSGKSSLVHAGVIPALRRGSRWQIAVFWPRSDPFEGLATACAPLLYPELVDKMERQMKRNTLADALHTRARMSVAHVVAMLELEKVSPAQRLLLVVDQFEELYTQSPENLQRLFLEELMALIEGPHPCTVLITLRSDFLEQAMAFGPLNDALNLNKYPKRFIPSMSQKELQDAIEKPAWQLGVVPETGLTDLILKDLGQAPGRLPLLQFTLAELWTRRSQARLTHAAYQAIGGVDKALATYADAVLSRFPAEQERLRRIFVQLVHPGERTADTRQVATRAEVGATNWELVRQLADTRLVVTGHDDARGQDTVEVVHEALIRHWKPLQQWMEQDRQFREWQTRLRQRLQDWMQSGATTCPGCLWEIKRLKQEGQDGMQPPHNSDDEALLRGTPLAQAEAQLADGEVRLAPNEQVYIEVSVQHRDQVLEKQQEERQKQQEERREREQLQEKSYLLQHFKIVPAAAGVIGAVTRIGLSWIFGSFLDLPGTSASMGAYATLSHDALLKPAFHGFFGTFVGGFLVVFALAHLPRDKDALTLRRVAGLVGTGVCWGAVIALLIARGAPDAQTSALHWYQHGVWGYPITGTCWGFGLALGTYLGNRLGTNFSDFSHVASARLWGGTLGVVCFLLLSLLMIGFFSMIGFLFPESRDGHNLLWSIGHAFFTERLDSANFNLLRRTWGEVFQQSISVWAVVFCFTRREKRRSFATSETAPRRESQ